MNELYLVTGAAGHLGTALLQQLKLEKKKVRILVLPQEKNIPKDVEVCYGDVLRTETLADFFRPSAVNQKIIVIHSAGIVSIASKYEQKVYDVNVKGTKNIVEMCVSHGIKKLIYVSSVHAIPEKPHGKIITETSEFSPDKVQGLYSKTKAEATALVLNAVKERGLNASIVHPSGIIGPYDPGRGNMTAMVTDYCKGMLTSVVRGGYDFVDVRDVANGIITCAQKGRSGQCYILSNKYFTIKKITDLLHIITGRRRIKSVLPNWFAELTAPLAETYYKILKKPSLYTKYSLFTLKTNSIFSHKKADEELGYTTRPIEETLKDTVQWLQDSGRIKGV